MDRFEFLMVLMSIIIGLGLSELLTNVARQIRARKNSKVFWVHSGTVVLLLVAFLQIWWETWDLRVIEVWTFPSLMMMLAAPAGLFMISHIVFPDVIEGADFEDYYFRNSRVLWSIAAFVVIASTGFRPIAFGHDLLTNDNLSSILMLGVFVALAASKRKALHLAALPAILAMLILDIMVFKPVL